MTLPHPEDDPRFWEHVPQKRFLAWLVDLAVTLVIVLVLVVASAGLVLFLLPVVWSAVAVGYRWVMLGRYGATLGMLLVALRLRHLDGRRPAPEVCLWHAGLHALSMVFVLPQILSVGMILTTPWRQGLNDWLLGTTIVNKPID